MSWETLCRALVSPLLGRSSGGSRWASSPLRWIEACIHMREGQHQSEGCCHICPIHLCAEHWGCHCWVLIWWKQVRLASLACNIPKQYDSMHACSYALLSSGELGHDTRSSLALGIITVCSLDFSRGARGLGRKTGSFQHTTGTAQNKTIVSCLTIFFMCRMIQGGHLRIPSAHSCLQRWCC